MKYLTLENELSAMKELNVTPNEFKFIQYTIIAQADGSQEMAENGVLQGKISSAYRLLYDYMSVLRSNGISLIEMIESLKDRSIINKTTKLVQGQAFHPEDIEFNKRKLNKFIKSPLDLFYELWNNYPAVVNINGGETSLLGCTLPSIGVNSHDDCAILYARKIKSNPALHSEIMNLLEWGKSSGIINKTLINFIINEEWKALKRQRDEGKVDNTCRRSNSKEM